MQKICLFGPESVGKTVMAQELATHYRAPWVPEVAREFLDSNEFTAEQAVQIAREHVRRIQQVEMEGAEVAFFDTDIITTQLYCELYLGGCPQPLLDLEAAVSFDRYFLFRPDVPWVPDGMRDLGDRREEVYRLFERALQAREISYEVVEGNWIQRWQKVLTSVETLLQPALKK
jgi:HTH-type transcriptional regulator, transcriptional repressor of NAD biosynthesis genes